MELIDGERIIMDLDDGRVILTDYRIRSEFEGRGITQIKSLTLDNVTSCSLENETKPWLLMIALLTLGLACIGALNGRTEAVAVLVVGILFLVAYSLTRKTLLQISSPTIAIKFTVPFENRDEWIEFIDAVEMARLRLIVKGLRTQS